MRFRVILPTALLLFALASVADEPRKADAPKTEGNPDVAELMKAIAGKEEKPAGEVFKNVQLMKDVPAARFLRIMEMGYARSLGVGCEHCHDEEMWEADDKRPKRAAREMIVLVRDLNQKLAKMENLDNTQPTVNCTTCHRGQVKPAIQLDKK